MVARIDRISAPTTRDYFIIYNVGRSGTFGASLAKIRVHVCRPEKEKFHKKLFENE